MFPDDEVIFTWAQITHFCCTAGGFVLKKILHILKKISYSYVLKIIFHCPQKNFSLSLKRFLTVLKNRHRFCPFPNIFFTVLKKFLLSSKIFPSSPKTFFTVLKKIFLVPQNILHLHVLKKYFTCPPKYFAHPQKDFALACPQKYFALSSNRFLTVPKKISLSSKRFLTVPKIFCTILKKISLIPQNIFHCLQKDSTILKNISHILKNIAHCV